MNSGNIGLTIKIDGEIGLRLLRMGHAKLFYKASLRNRAALLQAFPSGDGKFSVASTKRFMRSRLEQYSQKRGYHFGIWMRAEIVGAIDLHQVDHGNRRAGIASWLDESFQGRGLMTRACRALLDSPFSELDLNRVEIQCAEQNRKSRAIPERLGFVQEGVIRQAEWIQDHFNDHVVYSMLRDEWRRNPRQDSSG